MNFMEQVIKGMLFAGLTILVLVIVIFIKELCVECIYKCLGKDRGDEDSNIEAGTEFGRGINSMRVKA